MSVTRLPNGLSTAVLGTTLADYGLPDPTKWHVWFDDFDNFEADQWIITRVGTTPTEAIQNERGGVLKLTMAATDDSADSLQWSGDDPSATIESFKFTANKNTFFKARFKVSDATQSDFVMGLQITDTTPLAVTDGVYFRKDDGDTQLDFVVIKDSTATTKTNVYTVVNDTYFTVGFHYDGVNPIKVFAATGLTETLLTTAALTNLVDDEELTISFHMQNGEAVAKSMSIDYIFAAEER